MPYTEDEVPYVETSKTSRAAAERLRTKEADEERILELMAARGSRGVTCDEIEVDLALLHQTASARLKGLRDKNRIVKTASIRRTRQGRAATVYVLPGRHQLRLIGDDEAED